MRLLFLLSAVFCSVFTVSDLLDPENAAERQSDVEDQFLPVFLITFFGALLVNILTLDTDILPTIQLPDIQEEKVKAVLITGNYDFGVSESSAEIYIPSNSSSCVLPSLPVLKYDHSLDGGLACGVKNCHLWNSDVGSWDLSHTLTVERDTHTSWTPSPDSGTYLMGGRSSARSVQLVNTGGTVDPEMVNFLRYETRDTCGISDGDQFIIMGGFSNQLGRGLDKVHVYDTNGWVKDLPSLSKPRAGHACASFMANGERFLLVTGGAIILTYSTQFISDKTEIFTESQTSWRTLSARLPVPKFYSKAVSIDNKVLLFGGYDIADYDPTGDFRDAILEFSPMSESWTSVGMMKEPRVKHAISVVNFEDFVKHCDFSRSIDAPRGPPVRPPYRQYLETKQKKRKNRRKNEQKSKKNKHNL